MAPRPDPDGGVREGAAMSRPLRIAFVYDALFPYQRGGAERRFHELASRLRDRHEVHYYSWRHWDGPAVVERDGITFHGVGVPRELYGGDGKRTVREAAAFAGALVRSLARQRFDVVDCSATPYVPVYACWAATRATGTPMVATWHEFWGEHWFSYLPHRRSVAQTAMQLERHAVRFADRVVAVSDFTARQMPGRTRADVVENGMGLAPPAGLAPGGRAANVLFVGRLIEDKGVDILLRAMAPVGEAIPDARCVVIGDGPERAALANLRDSLGLSEKVEFRGHVGEGELIAHLERAAVFAFPSVREGFGICVAEAQAFGAVPVVARAPHSAASTLVVDGVTGIVCEPNAEQFATAICDLLRDRDRRDRMAAAAMRHAERWNWDTIASRMEGLYEETAGTRSRRAWPFGRQRSARSGPQPVNLESSSL